MSKAFDSIHMNDGLGRLKKLPKLLRCETSVAHYTAESESINWIVAWNCKNARTVGHNDVLGLTNDFEACFLKSTYGCEMIDAGKLRQDFRLLLQSHELLRLEVAHQ